MSSIVLLLDTRCERSILRRDSSVSLRERILNTKQSLTTLILSTKQPSSFTCRSYWRFNLCTTLYSEREIWSRIRENDKAWFNQYFLIYSVETSWRMNNRAKSLNENRRSLDCCSNIVVFSPYKYIVETVQRLVTKVNINKTSKTKLIWVSKQIILVVPFVFVSKINKMQAHDWFHNINTTHK